MKLLQASLILLLPIACVHPSEKDIYKKSKACATFDEKKDDVQKYNKDSFQSKDFLVEKIKYIGELGGFRSVISINVNTKRRCLHERFYGRLVNSQYNGDVLFISTQNKRQKCVETRRFNNDLILDSIDLTKCPNLCEDMRERDVKEQGRCVFYL